MHSYGHPSLTYPTPLKPDSIVEHKNLPGVPLVIVGEAVRGISGERYMVNLPGGEVVPVLKKNLVI